MDLKIDPNRTTFPETGIYVRALDAEERWGSHDINHLTRESLVFWMEGRPPEFAREVVLCLLRHPR